MPIFPSHSYRIILLSVCIIFTVLATSMSLLPTRRVRGRPFVPFFLFSFHSPSCCSDYNLSLSCCHFHTLLSHLSLLTYLLSLHRHSYSFFLPYIHVAINYPYHICSHFHKTPRPFSSHLLCFLVTFTLLHVSIACYLSSQFHSRP